MSKSIRRQLADALHELRAKENAIEDAVHERDVRIQALLTEVKRLRLQLQRQQLRMYVVQKATEVLSQDAEVNVAELQEFATGKSEHA